MQLGQKKKDGTKEKNLIYLNPAAYVLIGQVVDKKVVHVQVVLRIYINDKWLGCTMFYTSSAAKCRKN